MTLETTHVANWSIVPTRLAGTSASVSEALHVIPSRWSASMTMSANWEPTTVPGTRTALTMGLRLSVTVLLDTTDQHPIPHAMVNYLNIIG